MNQKSCDNKNISKINENVTLKYPVKMDNRDFEYFTPSLSMFIKNVEPLFDIEGSRYLNN